MAVIRFNFLSKYLGMQTNVTICLPSFSFADIMEGKKDIYVKGMKFQTLYLLHGGSGDDSDYLHFSNITRYADEAKLAVVMPSAYNSDYTDNPQGPRYWRFISEELPAVCQAMFPLSDRREDNFVAGLSMGSHGAMKLGLQYCERYTAALIMSGAARHPDIVKGFGPPKQPAGLEMDPDIMPIPNMSAIYGDLDMFKGSKHDAYHYAKLNVEQGKRLPKFFFTCGDKDFAFSRCKQGYQELTDLGYDTFFEEVPGYAHEWDFWDLSLRKAIREWLPLRKSAIYPDLTS